MKRASGKFVVRVPPELHRRARELAARRGQSLNRFCVEALERAVRGGSASASSAAGSALQLLVDCCRSIFGAQLLGVVLFGSIARGEELADSDLDVLLVVDRSIPIRRALYARWESEVEPQVAGHFEREVTPHFVHLPERVDDAGGLWLETGIDGEVLWERERLVSSFLRSVRDLLARGGAVRRVRHGHSYWVKADEQAEAGRDRG